MSNQPTYNDSGPAFAGVAIASPGQWASASPGMSLRQYAAIQLRVPDSGLDWLDAMILLAKRDEFAGMALQGYTADMDSFYQGPQGTWNETKADLAYRSYELADAMLSERVKGTK